jgi:hypothetical protein
VNGTGFIDDGRQLFGTSMNVPGGGQAQNGYEALRQFDSNNDGKIDSQDLEYGKIGVLEADGSYLSLSEIGISSISLDSTPSSAAPVSGNREVSRSVFTWSNGTTGLVADYDLASNTIVSMSTASIEIDASILALPDAAGLGIVRSLHESMQLDSQGELSDLVQQFTAASSIGLQEELLNQIILKWAGVDTLPHTLPGLHMDNQVFAAVEKFYGSELVFNGQRGAPGIFQAEHLAQAFSILKDGVYSQLMFEGPIKDLWLLTASGNYTSQSDSTEHFDLTAVANSLLAEYSSNAESAKLRMAEYIKAMNGSGYLELSDFQTTFYDLISNGSLELKNVIDLYNNGVLSYADNATIVRSSYGIDETITTYGSNDYVYLGDGNVTLNSFGSNTWVEGGRFNKNIINLGAGNNRVYLRSPGTSIEQIDVLGADAEVNFGPGSTLIVEGQGNGKFFFDQGDGELTVRGGAVDLSRSHTDRIVFGAGIAPGDIQMSLEGTALTNVRLNFNGSTDTILMENAIVSSSSSKHVTEFEFADGSVLNLSLIHISEPTRPCH